MNRCTLIILAIALTASIVNGQTKSDTSSSAAARDTIAAGNSGVDTVVVYSAKDSIVYSMKTKFMHLYNSSDVQYQSMGLKAERVSVNWSTSTLTAVGVPDTVKKDSTIGRPVMKDGGDDYHGDVVNYNFKSKKGKINIGKTEIENGFYTGEQIKKFESNVLYVQDGIYTTCDASHPHFYFYSPKMKVMVRDKVVAEPVYFFVADVPIFALPFGVFPSRGGRASGLIAPAYSEDNRFGKMLNHLGYYFAISDYLDLATAFDLSTRGGWQNFTNIRYAQRYDFSGSLNGRWVNMTAREQGAANERRINGYDVSVIHNQSISPTSRADVNFRFSSGNFSDYSFNLNDILMQNIYSTATYWKSWDNGNRSLTLSVTRDQSLTTNETNETLPSLSFTQSTVFPFRKRTKTRGLSGSSETDYGFLDMLGFSYNANFLNRQSKTTSYVDSVKTFVPDTGFVLKRTSDFKRAGTRSLSQGLGFSIAPKLGVFTIAPSLSLSDSRTWTDVETPYRQPSDSLIGYGSTRDKIVQGFLSAGISTSTRFYGIAQPRMLGIAAIRHTVNPTLGFTYNKQIYGDNIQKYSMFANLNVGNNVEAKYQKADTLKEEKLQLLNFGGGISYNFVADSMRFSELGVNFRTDIGRLLNISGSASYNLYKYEPTARTRVNKFLLTETGKFGDLTNFNLSVGTSFRGEKKQTPSTTGVPEPVAQEQARASNGAAPAPPKKTFRTIYDHEDADFSILWNVSLSWMFSQSTPAPGVIYRSSSANINLSFNLTDKWQISTGASYDFVNKKHFIPSVDVSRDLHCWTMSFSWYPMGYLEGYRLELKVKAPQLQDIKVTKQNRQRGLY
ncbi:MAG: LPS-assembly protein LptD [Ignavibacteriales bacterium]|nr:LPS-assembly protein LptD [Ignavibacteriales bacterium]